MLQLNAGTRELVSLSRVTAQVSRMSMLVKTWNCADQWTMTLTARAAS